MTRLASLALVALGLTAASLQEVSGTRIRVHTRFLASDLMEGRGVGARGGDLATEYLAAELELAGARPAGDNGTFFQKVPLIGVETQPSVQLAAAGKKGTIALRWLQDFVGVSHRQKTLDAIDAEAVFVGHGIVAPEFHWDDYQGADVRGKAVILFTNEPPSEDPKFFGGQALTYYGRWTYKYEQARKAGAAAAIIIHTTPTAGYGWDVVRASWGREDTQVRLEPGAAALGFAGWVTREAGEQLLGLSGLKVDEMLKRADSADFKPTPLGFRLRGKIPSKVRAIETRNVAGLIPGGELASEAVIFGAHWDHLGVGAPVDGDAIYNGAVDNATGCALLLEVARVWAALPQRPRRSALFLFFAAEEGGLRGSEYYAAHPLVEPARTAAALNFDAFYPFGRTSDLVLSGAERTTLWPLIQDIARRMDFQLKPDPRPEQGSFFRSDHFPLARVGIPAFSVRMGDTFRGKPDGFGAEVFKQYNAKHYHQPSDEYREDWDFSGIEDIARFALLLGLEIANAGQQFTWNPGEEYRAVREGR